jgi:pSer/pThr/pTyr-binding forkhead associated (FHA) protein
MYSLTAGQHIIGRTEDVSVPLMMSKISRHHAEVIVADGVLAIRDLDSRNGTYVNGTRIAGMQPLRPGDEIRIGGQTLVVGVASDDTTEADSRTLDPNR